jgi:hypothetical protein
MSCKYKKNNLKKVFLIDKYYLDLHKYLNNVLQLYEGLEFETLNLI